jgi:hypothetical protein
MRGTGATIKRMGTEPTRTRTTSSTLGNGLRTSSTESDTKYGPIKTHIPGSTSTEKRAVRGSSSGRTGRLTRARSRTTRSVGLVYISGAMGACTSGIGRRTECTGTERSYGPMVKASRVTISRIRSTVAGFFHGRTGNGSMANGRTAHKWNVGGWNTQMGRRGLGLGRKMGFGGCKKQVQ